jgi:hypothetical protein
MISSGERRKRAKRLIIWYEILSIGAVVLLSTHLVLNFQVPRAPDYDRAFIFGGEILIPVEDIVSHKSIVRAISIDTGRARDTDFDSPGCGWVTNGQAAAT